MPEFTEVAAALVRVLEQMALAAVAADPTSPTDPANRVAEVASSDVTISPATHQGHLPTESVTPPQRRPAMTAAERQRRKRAKDRELPPMLFSAADWRLFMDPATLGQKAGCESKDIGRLVLRELVDNALDAGASVTINHLDDGTWTIKDDGSGIDPALVPKLFCVNRDLVSSKRNVRLPLRGMLGNGLRVVTGAVAAFRGSLAVETRGRRLTLQPNVTNGHTDIIADESIEDAGGVTVRFSADHPYTLSSFLADQAIAIAKHGRPYDGKTNPHWYGAADILRMVQDVTPGSTSVHDLCRQIFEIDVADDRPATEIAVEDAKDILRTLRAAVKPISPSALGYIGRDYGISIGLEHYALVPGTATFSSDAQVAYVVEAWATCRRSDGRGRGASFNINLLLNRTPSVSNLQGASYSDGLLAQGCGLRLMVDGPKTADYNITLSLITPHIELINDGKSPSLSPFRAGIQEAIKKAASAAYRAMEKPTGRTSIKEAAWRVMARAYAIASGDGTYPANARQIMYAARPAILAATGQPKLNDKYFTQQLLPDYFEEHAEETAGWDVVFDGRGRFVEPHTDHEFALSTIGVRTYLGERPRLGTAISLVRNGGLFPTSGPVNRFRNILFVEKEGFEPLLQAANIAARFDIAIMSTKGMSVVAARHLLDRLAPNIDKILVLHDFDVSGFSIFGTLHSDNRRYTFTNSINAVDIGLHLVDVETLNLQSEPVQTSGDWETRAETLETHGATREEISFLRTRRVELNAMPADVFVRFLERKLAEHGVAKVVPDDTTILAHARRVIEQKLAEREMLDMSARIKTAAAAVVIPEDIRQQIEDIITRQPDLPWDLAVARVVQTAQ